MRSASEFSAIERQRTIKSMEMNEMGSGFKHTNKKQKKNTRKKFPLVGKYEMKELRAKYF